MGGWVLLLALCPMVAVQQMTPAAVLCTQFIVSQMVFVQMALSRTYDAAHSGTADGAGQAELASQQAEYPLPVHHHAEVKRAHGPPTQVSCPVWHLISIHGYLLLLNGGMREQLLHVCMRWE